MIFMALTTLAFLNGFSALCLFALGLFFCFRYIAYYIQQKKKLLPYVGLLALSLGSMYLGPTVAFFMKWIWGQDLDVILYGYLSYIHTPIVLSLAMFLGYKSIAISLASYKDQKFITAARYLCEMLESGIHKEIAKNEVLNINIPNLDYDKIKGSKVTCIGHRIYYNFVREEKDENGETVYLIGGDEPHWTEIENSDANAVKNGYISITPIAPDFTKKDSFGQIRNWIDKNK